MKHDGRCVSPAVRAASLDDKILLLLLAQQMLRANHLVMGGELLLGPRQTGRTVGRVDYRLSTLCEAGHIVTRAPDAHAAIACRTAASTRRSTWRAR